MAAKLKCKKCGKREAVLVSKSDLQKGLIPPSVLDTFVKWFEDYYNPKTVYCKACGYYEKM